MSNKTSNVGISPPAIMWSIARWPSIQYTVGSMDTTIALKELPPDHWIALIPSENRKVELFWDSYPCTLIIIPVTSI